MRNIKTIVSFSAAGFILSLIFGIFSNSSFIRVLLVALAWAIAFGLLGLLISFLFNTVLKVESSSYSSSEASPSQGMGIKTESLGNNVDIVVEDQELDRTESVNRYSVGQNHQMLNDSDLDENKTAQENASAAVSDNPGFVPIRNLETYKNISGTESVKPSELKKKEDEEEELEEIEEIEGVDSSSPSNNVQIAGTDDALDVLPDMGEYVSSGNVNTNDGFGYDGSGYSDSSYGNSNKKVDGENMQNTELIAKAISSVLSAET